MMSAWGAALEKMRRLRFRARVETERLLWERNGATFQGVRYRSTVEEYVNDDGSAAIVVRLYKLVDSEAIWVSPNGVRRMGEE
jgi:hypothetical protein